MFKSNKIIEIKNIHKMCKDHFIRKSPVYAAKDMGRKCTQIQMD